MSASTGTSTTGTVPRTGEALPCQPAAGDSQRPANRYGDQQRERCLPGDNHSDLAARHAQRLEQGEFLAPPADQT